VGDLLKRMTPETCPQCGADVPARARACPECGSDAKTGWSEAARYDALGLPDDSFNHDEFVREEFQPRRTVRQPARIWRWVALGLVLALSYGLWLALFRSP
jgi:predicted amidophosphoribosyltransferase